MSKAAKYVDTFLSGMETSGRNLYNKTIGYIRDLDTDINGKLVRTSNNVSLIDDVAGAYFDFFNSATYNSRINTLIESLPKIQASVNRAYKKQFGEIPSALDDTATGFTARYQDALEGVLRDDNVAGAVTNPVINDLFYQVGKFANLDTVESDYRDTEDALHAFFITKVTVLLEQYERQLDQLYSEAFGVLKWEYAGPDDKRTRDFCSERVGGFYTKEEIQAWADEDWAGKIPSTNAQNIFVNAGGFNCRHTFVPVEDDAVYMLEEQIFDDADFPEIQLAAKQDPFTPDFTGSEKENAALINTSESFNDFAVSGRGFTAKETADAAGLTPEQHFTIKDYTGSGYVNINDHMRSKERDFSEFAYDGSFKEVQAKSEELYRGLEKLPQEFPFTEVYRHEFTSEDHLKKLLSNNVVTFDGFTSTSYETSSAFFGADDFYEGNSGGEEDADNIVRMIITLSEEDTRGRDISMLSKSRTEYEFLFLSNTKFKITSWDPARRILKLQEL